MWLPFSGFYLRTQRLSLKRAPHNSGGQAPTLCPSAVFSLTLRAAHQPNSFGVLRRAQDGRKEFEMIEGIPFMLRPLEAFRTFLQQPAKQNFACGGLSRTAHGAIFSSERSDRADILIQMEQVSRVILRFQRSQALVVRSVGCRDGVFAIIVSQIVYVAPRREAGPHHVIRFPSPRNILRVVVRDEPLRDDQKVIALAPVGERRLTDTDTRRCAVNVLQQQAAHRRGTGRELRNERVDGLIAQFTHEIGFPIVEGTPRESSVEHPIRLLVACWTDGIENRSAELLNRLKGSLCFGEGTAMPHNDDGDLSAVGRMKQRAEDREVVGQSRGDFAEELQHIASPVEGVRDEPTGDCPHRVQAVLQPRDSAEVAASALKTPEEIGILFLARRYYVARSGYDFRRS